MAQVTKVVELDGAGAGSVNVGPCFFLGGAGYAAAENHGDSLGTAFLTRGTARFVVGEIDLQGGAPHGEAVLYLDRD